MERFEGYPDVSCGEKLVGNRPVQFSVRFFVAGKCEGTRKEVNPGLKVAGVARSFAASLGLEWKLPDHNTTLLRVKMPLTHSWQARQPAY